MGPPDTLVYLLLRTAVPEYEVFARVALSTFVSAEGADAETRRRLSQTPVDFLICDREMRAVVAIELDVAGRAEMSGERRIRAETLQAAGIRLVRLNAAALPRRAEARSLIVGGASAPGPARP